MKRKIKQNIYGNWCGYQGTRRAREFGADEIAAAYWMLTGLLDFNAGYAPEWLAKCQELLKQKPVGSTT